MVYQEFDGKVTEFMRGLVGEQLDQCTGEQITLFNRMYKSIDEIAVDKMRRAYYQCRKTVLENKEKSNG